MTDDPVANLVRLQLVALTDIRRILREQNSRLIRLEHRIEQNSINLDRLTRKDTTNE